MHKQNTNGSGFTIVELLIVVVVIAILAAISVVAYTGIQQRATNSAIISAVNQTVKSVSGYIAVNGTYPSTGTFCLVTGESSCRINNINYATDTTLTNNLKTISTLPSSVPDALTNYNGISYHYSAGRTFNTVPAPLAVFYSLLGWQQKCGVSNVTNTGGSAMVSSTTGWTDTSGNYTICVISIAGP